MEFSVHTAPCLAWSRDQEANWTEPAQAQHGARRLAPSLSRPTVNNELRGALRLTRRIPVAFTSRNDRALHQHMPGLCKFFGLAQIRIVGQRPDNRPNLGQ